MSMFLKLPNTSVQVEVIGERINRGGGYGLVRTSNFISLLRPRKRCKLAQEQTKDNRYKSSKGHETPHQIV